jgi:hypothetical protein
MSLLPSATFAGPGTAEALWAAAGSVGPGGGVTQIVAGLNVSIDPPTGLGVVTINSTGGGGGGGVTSVTNNGPGIAVSPTTGAVQIENTGVTSIVAGTNVSISGSTGAVTINAPLAAAFATSATDTIYTFGLDPADPPVFAGVNMFQTMVIPTNGTMTSQTLEVYAKPAPGVVWRLQDYFAIQVSPVNVAGNQVNPVTAFAGAFINAARGGAVDLKVTLSCNANFSVNGGVGLGAKMVRVPWNGP